MKHIICRKYLESNEDDRCPNDEWFGKKKTTVDKYRPGIVCANRSWPKWKEDSGSWAIHESRDPRSVNACLDVRADTQPGNHVIHRPRNRPIYINNVLGDSESAFPNPLTPPVPRCFHLLSSTRATTYYYCVKASRYTRRYRWTLVELQRIARNVVSSIFRLCFFYRQSWNS